MNIIKQTSISDLPYNEDFNDFGTDRYVNGLIKFIESSSAPITIALQGEWGSGKTSLMTRLEKALCNGDNTHFVGININTWEYSMLSTPEETVVKIIYALTNAISGGDIELKNHLKNMVMGVVNTGLRIGREYVKNLFPGAGVVVEGANIGDKLPFENSVTLAELKKALTKAVINATKATKKGIIIFIDDLDRLNPPVAVEILELLKNIFTLDKCIFVLAIDYDVVVKGLEPKFGKLTDKNEREFRSFFDKIIQVPFSLPVSSYKPMKFILDTLVSIGYISSVQRYNEEITDPIETIVNYSVGKNPRSIKRLINTLSLLSCISNCGNDDNKFNKSAEGLIAQLAIVALQVCYHKIYRMIAYMPEVDKWNAEICTRFNIHPALNENETLDWKSIIRAACTSDNYLSQHRNDIVSLISLILNTIKNYAGEDSDFESNIRSVIDQSSVTGINDSIIPEEVNRKRLMDSLHRLVPQKIRYKRKDIVEIKPRNNTGNGGFKIQYSKDLNIPLLEITLRLHVTDDKITCQIILPTYARRPEHLVGKSFDEIMADPKIGSAFKDFDALVIPLLKRYYFKSTTFANGLRFKSFSEEKGYWINQGLENELSGDISYWIDLKTEDSFSEPEILEAIADTIIAAYDWRKTTYNL